MRHEHLAGLCSHPRTFDYIRWIRCRISRHLKWPATRYLTEMKAGMTWTCLTYAERWRGPHTPYIRTYEYMHAYNSYMPAYMLRVHGDPSLELITP